jgi:hypothetical protein
MPSILVFFLILIIIYLIWERLGVVYKKKNYNFRFNCFFIQKGFLVFQIFIKFKKHFFEVFLCQFFEQEEKLK